VKRVTLSHETFTVPSLNSSLTSRCSGISRSRGKLFIRRALERCI